MDYWYECIAEAFEDANIKTTKEQIKIVALWVEGAHENYGMSHGYDCIPNPLNTEITKLKKKLEREQSKTICKNCNGTGRVQSYWLDRMSDSQCFECKGEGFIYHT